MLDCLQLLHFHIGSQISSIIPIKNAMQEAANLYVELAKLGADMKYLDVGGGLAVDYDGSQDRLPRLQELQHPGVRQRRGGGHPGGLRQGQPALPHHRQRERSRRQRAPVGAGVRGGGHQRGALRRASRSGRGGQPRAARALRDVPRRAAQEPAGGLPRRAAGQGRGREPVQARLPRACASARRPSACSGAAARRSPRRRAASSACPKS